MPTAPVKTAKVANRRPLEFHSYEELLADAEHLASIPVTALGNWSLGQVYQHLANALVMSLDGSVVPAPWYVRMVGRWLRNRVLNKPMSPGFNLPDSAAKVLVPGATDTATGLAALQAAVARMAAEPQRHPHSVFGEYTRGEWDRLHFRHAAMHLSFFIPEN